MDATVDAETRHRLQSLDLGDPLVREVLAGFLTASLFCNGIVIDAAEIEAALAHFIRRVGDWPGLQQDLARLRRH